MTIDLNQIPPAARSRYVEIGRQFGCADALAQAQQTITASEKFAESIADHGFIGEDTGRLRDARALLAAELEGVHGSTATGKRTSQAYVGAMRAGKTARQRARSILFIVAERLAYDGDAIDAEAARAASAALQQTESSRGDALRLAGQLDQLRAVLSMPRVDKMSAQRGGPETLELLAKASERLREACLSRIDPERDQERDQLLDLLAGIIVELVRDARRAARSAARALAQPAVAAAFELVRLYGPLGGGAADSERFPSLKS